MPVPLYTQTVIALVWDFDRTLIPGNMQDPIFDAYDVDPDDFWGEVDGLVEYYQRQGVRIQRDIAYLGHLLTYVRDGVFKGLTNERLLELGDARKAARGEGTQGEEAHGDGEPCATELTRCGRGRF